jgi:hypothetical protein
VWITHSSPVVPSSRDHNVIPEAFEQLSIELCNVSIDIQLSIVRGEYFAFGSIFMPAAEDRANYALAMITECI